MQFINRGAYFLAAPLILVATLVPAGVAQADDTSTPNAFLAQLTVETPDSIGYNRDLFPTWVDADGDGCNTRAEVLQEESLTPVTYSSGCTVATGQWSSPYDDAIWTNATDVDIDHLVPLGEAWASGARNWTNAQRQDYANDLDIPYALVAVTDNVNQSKGDRDPAQWMPPNAGYACDYVTAWIKIKWRWSLTIDQAEKTALTTYLGQNGCGEGITDIPPRKIDPASNAGSPTASPVAVYRFYSPIYHGHFFTIDPAERDFIRANWPNIWTYEGQRYTAFTTEQPGTVPLFRFWSARYNGHFYTTSPSERDHVDAVYDDYTWKYEKVAYWVYPTDTRVADTVPVARFWSSTYGHHFYTADPSEAATVKTYPAAIWSYENDNFRVPAVGLPLGAKIQLGCSGNLSSGTVVLSNPNRDATTATISYGPNNTTVAVDGYADYTFYLSALDEDSTGNVTVTGDGITVASQGYRIDCITPPPVVTPPPSRPANPGDTKNCTDFPDWRSAQNWFDYYYTWYGDIAKLDQDNDRIACESNRGHP